MTDADRPIPEYHEGLLKAAMKVEADAPLPSEVIDLYWDAERTGRRIGVRLDPAQLVTICLLANRMAPADPVSFLNAEPKREERVLAKFRGEWRWGKFKYIRGKAVVVELDDDTAEDREFSPTSVRRPAKEELKLIGE